MEKALYECDLHCHTTRSDGADSPQELILHAQSVGLKVLAITDHDIVPPKTIKLDDSGVEVDICDYALSKGLFLIRGIEISCETNVEDVHIVCFNCNWEDKFFKKLQEDVVRSKVESYRILIDRLHADGMDVTWKEVLENGGKPVPEKSVQKKMIFELLARKGYAKDWSEAKLMIKNRARYQIRRRKPDPLYVIGEVHRMGGYAIMAHPFLVNETVVVGSTTMSRESYIERLIRAGLDGIEACYTYDKTSYNGKLSKEEIADRIRCKYGSKLSIISGGSDYHADYKKGVKNPRKLGESGVTEEYFISNNVLRTLGYCHNNQGLV